MNFNISKNGGFSLIQLLVVIAIIGVLSSVVLANMSQVKMKARDAQRMSDLENIQLALRLYKDVNGTYPICDTGMMIGVNATTPTGCTTNVDTAIAPYMSKVPTDPLTALGTTYRYWYNSNYVCIAGMQNIILYARTAELSTNQGKWKGKGTSCFPSSTVISNSYGIILK